MIHVQIASELTPDGVAGVRWVLIEPADLPAGVATAATAAPSLDTPATLPAVPGRSHPGWRAWAVTGLCLVAALLAGRWQLGPPTLAGGLPAARPSAATPPAQRLAAPPPMARPGAGATVPGHDQPGTEVPRPAEPAAPASAPPPTERLITASLS